MKNYVIRVYRQNNENINNIVGILEDFDEDLQDSFSSMGELVKILCTKQKIISQVTEEEIEEMIRSSFHKSDHSGKHLNLADLRNSHRKTKELREHLRGEKS